jgi:tetratricopeptide (TPR) repeat protein/tRNA A-37 threonylcarbamoyl transferase component Bud32
MTDQLDHLKTALADRYTIERELGSGGMATVYLAEDVKHHRKVAVKVLRPELAAALGADRFHREIEIAANLTHPHILPLHDSGDADGFLYYVMPHIEGESLRDKLAHEGELPIGEAVRIIRDVVDALSEAHDRGVVHRDIKPDNILLTKHHALVTDFGVAKAVSEATGAEKLTTEGVALGTPSYMSPEQAAADPHIDHRADIYAVGVVAYELLTGRPPFLGTTPQMILSAHMTDTPEPVSKYRESVPPALEQLVMKCLEKKAADRWQSAEELLPQLETLATPGGGLTPTGILPLSRRTRQKWMMAGAAVALAAIITAIAVVAALPDGSGAALDPERVVVSALRNETSDPALDQVGRQAGHWITQGLQHTGIVQVVPWETALQASLYVQGLAEEGRVQDRVRAVAEETGAATVISGAFYRRGDGIQYQIEISDAANGRLLAALDPEDAPLELPDEAIEALRQKVMGSLAILLDERIASEASGVARPPSFEAYQTFSEGMMRYLRREWEEALHHFNRAFELDTTFLTALLYVAPTLYNLGRLAQMDSLVGSIEQSRDRLNEYDRHWLDYWRALVDGDQAAALRAIRRAAELAPGSRAVYNRAYTANRSNRPQEALDAILSLDPDRGPMRGRRAYWRVLTVALLMLGRYEEALEASQRAHQMYPDGGPYIRQFEAQALAVVGRLEQLHQVLDEIETAYPGRGSYVPVEASAALRAHGYLEGSRSVAERGVERFDARGTDDIPPLYLRWLHGRALILAGRYDEAQRIFDGLVEEAPQRVTDEPLDLRATRAFVATLRGDTMQALSDMEWLETREEDSSIERGIIAGVLGEHELAVELIRDGLRRRPGAVFGWENRIRVLYEPLRDYPPFQELMRPKG